MTTPSGHFPSPLRLLAGEAPSASATAWLLPGDDSSRWLEEIARWQVAISDVRLLPLPASPADNAVNGVLAISPVLPRVPPSSWALPYGALAEGIYAPVGASLSPPVSREELRRRVVWPVAIFHPGLGLVGCRTEDLLRPTDLIDPGSSRRTVWDRITPAPLFERRINSIRPINPPQVERLLSALADGVGEHAPGELPELPQESPGRRVADQLANALFKALGGTAGALAKAGPGWHWLAAWAKRHGETISTGLEKARAGELARLMQMLERDPDNGLRYALPLFSDSGRDVARPGGRLGPRNTNFSLGRLFSSRPTDNWNIQRQTRERLRHRYRELAERELGLRRYGRAAYIFANLLGDFHAAANALQQGKMWREAAVIYQEKLKDLRRAAMCLEHGGLSTEAIALYLQLHLHEHVAALYLTLGRPEDATAAYRTAVKEFLSRDDVLYAAKLLETKLAAPDEALEVLSRAWPHSKQAVRCACEAFDLLARLDRHDEAVRRLEQIRSRAAETAHVFKAIELTAHVAVAYPTQPARSLADDATRLLAGHALRGATPEQARTLLGFVERASAGDRLLRRDTERYLTTHTPPRPKLVPVSSLGLPSLDARAPRVLRTLTLSGRNDPWQTAVAIPGGYVAMAVYADHVIIVRGTWEGERFSAAVPWPAAKASPPRMVADQSSVWLYQPGTIFDLNGISLPAVGSLGPARVVGLPSAMGQPVGWSAAPDRNTHWLGFVDRGGPLTHHVFSDNVLIGTEDTDIALDEHATFNSMHYLAQADAQVFTAGQMLYLIRRGRPSLTLPLPGRPRRMTGTLASHAAVRVTLDFDDGAAVVWPLSGAIKPIAANMTDPVTLILPNGTMIASDSREGRLYTLEDRTPGHAATFKPAGGVVAWVPLDTAQQFASLSRNGTLTLYQQQ